jgi:predicted nucleotidyltransferase
LLLRNKDKELLTEIFSSFEIPVEVWAYGSRVDGTAHEGSDLDLVVLTQDREKMPVDTFLELKEKIRDSNIPILVDLFDWARLPESFHKIIEACHEVLFSSLVLVSEPENRYAGDDEKTGQGKSTE